MLFLCYSNIYICYSKRIYLAIFGTSCEGERSFSVLKRVKNCLRSTLGQNRMATLSLLSIESEVLRKLNCTEIIVNFAQQKCRKVQIL